VLLIITVWSVPTLGLLVSSFRPRVAIDTNGWWTTLLNPLGSMWTLGNYVEVLNYNGFAQSFLNSALVAVPVVALLLSMAAFASYAFAWMDFPFRRAAYLVFIALFVVPLQVAFIPVLQLFSKIGINGTFVAAWLAHCGFGTPLAIYIVTDYMRTIPRELIEAARVDGASELQTFFRVVFPLSLPVLAAFGILEFLWVWNDLLVNLVFLGSSTDTQVLTVRLQTMIGTHGEDWHLLTAGAFVSMAVPLFVFFAFQRYFVRGIVGGAVKG
jgi:alpha-glucoside transport system permease protein